MCAYLQELADSVYRAIQIESQPKLIERNYKNKSTNLPCASSRIRLTKKKQPVSFGTAESNVMKSIDVLNVQPLSSAFNQTLLFAEESDVVV